MDRLPRIRIALFAALVSLAGAARGDSLPFGATPMDQSAFALGSHTLNVVFVESDGTIDVDTEDWSAAQISAVQSEVAQATEFWENETSGYHPNARLSINVNYVNDAVPVNTGYEPINQPHTQDGLWINEVMGTLGYDAQDKHTNVRQFNQDVRIDQQTHWASTLFVVNDLNDPDNLFTDHFFAYSNLGGPYLVVTYDNNGWGISRFDQVLAHEYGHSFFALDEHRGSDERNTARSGYLNGINGNSELDQDGNLVVPPQPNALMLNSTLNTSPFTKIQVGHLDSDGDTVPDILDTNPLFLGSDTNSNSATGTFRFDGAIIVDPLDNLNPRNVGISNSRSAMTINTISSVEYNLDQAGWIPMLADDGQFDDDRERITLTLPGLPVGHHSIQLRGTNSVDNVSDIAVFDFTSTLAGILSDLTGNGFVDFEDLTILLANWNQNVGASEGNLVDVANTPVNFEDLTVLLADWTGPGPGATPEAALSAQAMPEPSSLLLAVIATFGLSACWWRRRWRAA